MDALKKLLADPRHYQIASLSGLLIYAVTALDLEVSLSTVALTLGSALGWQWLAGRVVGIEFDPRSPMISGLSLCLLMRGDAWWLPIVGAGIAIVGKFAIRFRGKHVFNPTNLALAVALLALPGVWVSPGQWGRPALLVFGLVCVGGLVIHRAARSDVTYAFLGSYGALIFGRALWLGDPLAIPLHQLGSGALLIFAFFMISDPKTTPDTRAGRILFAALVATGAFLWQFELFRTNGLIWSLAALSMTTPLIDRLLPGKRYRWPRALTLDLKGSAPAPVAAMQRRATS